MDYPFNDIYWHPDKPFCIFFISLRRDFMFLKLFRHKGFGCFPQGELFQVLLSFLGTFGPQNEYKTWPVRAHAHTRTHAHTHTHTHTHRESAAVFCPHITWLSVPENPSRHVLTSQHGDSFTQTLSGPDAKQSGNLSARLCEGVIKRGVKTDPTPPPPPPPGAQRVSLLYHQTRTHAPLKPNQRNAWGCLQSVLLIPKKK